jgi:hypothetical protein
MMTFTIDRAGKIKVQLIATIDTGYDANPLDRDIH